MGFAQGFLPTRPQVWAPSGPRAGLPSRSQTPGRGPQGGLGKRALNEAGRGGVDSLRVPGTRPWGTRVCFYLTLSRVYK